MEKSSFRLFWIGVPDSRNLWDALTLVNFYQVNEISLSLSNYNKSPRSCILNAMAFIKNKKIVFEGVDEITIVRHGLSFKD